MGIVVSKTAKDNQNCASDDLAAWSPKDRTWNEHRAHLDQVQAIYQKAEQFERLAARMQACSGRLMFAWQSDDDGVISLRLQHAKFCRVRHCPVCQWRRSLMWLARFYQALPRIEAEHPKARWLLLTLTVRNCPVTQLRTTIKQMNRSWHALVKRDAFRAVQGWIRATEVTRGKDGSAHPHFHCLLMVPPSYFSGQYYVTQKRWTELWRDVMRLDYDPVVDIRVVKPQLGGVSAAAPEVLKYGTKPADLVADPEWLYEYTRQVYKLRFIAAGGALKNALREDEETDEDLIHVECDEAEPKAKPKSLLAFDWRREVKRYRRNVNADIKT